MTAQPTQTSLQSVALPTATIPMRAAVAQRVLVFDGAMGTNIQTFNPTSEDFRGCEGCNDYLNITRPEVIQAIHEQFLACGCDCVETNTFGSNRIKLDEYGLGDQLEAINVSAVQLARQAILNVKGPTANAYVVGSLGPTGYLPGSSDPTLSAMDVITLQDTFEEQARVLINAGVDALIIETGQDLLEMKHAVVGAKKAIAQAKADNPKRDVVLMAQPTLDTTGRMLLGTDTSVILPVFMDLDVDVLGFNCSTGPDEMREAVRMLAQHWPKPISVIPNAGLPENVDGCAHYVLGPEAMTQTLLDFVDSYGVGIVGGCCGTTPEHIRQLVDAVKQRPPKIREVEPLHALAGPIQAMSLDMDNKPIIVGERLNSQGSRKFKEMLMADDWDKMIALGRQQVDEGAHMLDVCVALNERDDEQEQMLELVKGLYQQVEAPLVIDSTEYHVIETVLKAYPGRSLINSIHLEGEGERLHRIVPMLKQYGGAAVAMLIDENGMAKTADKKAEVAQKIHDTCTQQYHLPAHALVFDPLTFTLATGDEEFRRSAIETLDAIRWIKTHLPDTYTILGVSNVSFGLTPPARRVLNSAFLYHATQAGLDMAIVNAKEIIPYPTLSDQERTVADNLIFDRSDEALADFITYFETNQQSGKTSSQRSASLPDDWDTWTPEAQIHYHILNRVKDGVEDKLGTLLKQMPPAAIINDILLPAMKEVGEKMATGELILPFVLQSAEVMKKSVSYLEQFLDKDEQVHKGTLVLATVYGDVHDIGKNLVKTIFSNNGYIVHDLGKQVPLPIILEKAREVNADAIGLSALLVTTSKQMAYCVEECQKTQLNTPIIIGGAAINRDFGFRISCLKKDQEQAEELIYPGGVFYAKDAFEGLAVMNRLQKPDEHKALIAEYHAEIQDSKERQEKYKQLKAQQPAAPTVKTLEDAPDIPSPSRMGIHTLTASDIDLDDVFSLMDFASLYRLSWGLKNMAQDEYNHMLATEFEPMLKDLMDQCKRDAIFEPFVVYGYYPCAAQGNDLVIYDPENHQHEIERFNFPRQTTRDGLCLSDYFMDSRNDQRDIIPIQLVTMGRKVGQVCSELDTAHEYSRSYYLHGLAVQMAEGLAEWMHRHIRTELSLPSDRGKRYSFGYPACPDLADQQKLFRLLKTDTHAPFINLTDAFQIEPEQSTSAIIIHHPKAKYYAV